MNEDKLSPPDSDTLERILNHVDTAKTFVYDVETSGVDWKRNPIVGYVLTFAPTPEQNFYVPVRHGGGGNIEGGVPLIQAEENFERHPWEVEFFKRLKKRDDSLRMVGHNLKFDLLMSAECYEYFPKTVECTRVNAALIDENAGQYSLSAVAKRYGVTEKLGEELYAHIEATVPECEIADRGAMEHYWRLAGDDRKAVEYALGDGITTWEVWERQQNDLDEQDLRLVWALECSVIRTLARMERRGIEIDQKKLEEVNDWIEGRLGQANNVLPADLNVRSPLQLEELFRSAGITDWPVSPKLRRPSFPEEWLKTNELGKQIISVRKLKHLQNSFITPLIEQHIFDGRIHAEFNQVKFDEYGTVTGRMSSSKPNLQQVPKRNKELGEPFRSVFIPGDNCYWSANDYSQQEYRTAAHYFQSEKLMEGYRQVPAVDMHATVAEMFGLEDYVAPKYAHIKDDEERIKLIKKDARTLAKTFNFGRLYGMGDAKMAKQLEIPEHDAKRFGIIYFDEVPEAKILMNTAKKKMLQRGWVKTFFGRRRRITDTRFAYKAMNAIIQGGCADMTKDKMVLIDQFFESEGDKCGLLAQVHDELNWLVPFGCEAQDEEARRIMTDVAGPPYNIKIPMSVDSSSVPIEKDGEVVWNGRAQNWAEASYYD